MSILSYLNRSASAGSAGGGAGAVLDAAPVVDGGDASWGSRHQSSPRRNWPASRITSSGSEVSSPAGSADVGGAWGVVDETAAVEAAGSSGAPVEGRAGAEARATEAKVAAALASAFARAWERANSWDERTQAWTAAWSLAVTSCSRAAASCCSR